jgi:hypothetical protein
VDLLQERVGGGQEGKAGGGREHRGVVPDAADQAGRRRGEPRPQARDEAELP